MSRKPPDRRSIGDAKARFAECIRQAEAGVETILTRHGRPVARIVASMDVIGADDEVREGATSYSATAPTFRSARARGKALRELLEDEIWPRVPEHLRGRAPNKMEREKILGYGDQGV
jgi:prevent-host-death family protein